MHGVPDLAFWITSGVALGAVGACFRKGHRRLGLHLLLGAWQWAGLATAWTACQIWRSLCDPAFGTAVHTSLPELMLPAFPAATATPIALLAGKRELPRLLASPLLPGAVWVGVALTASAAALLALVTPFGGRPGWAQVVRLFP